MRVSIDEGTLEVRVHGTGAAIVLLHGFPFSGEIWRKTADAIAPDARVVVPDLRGSGRSTVTPGPYLMENLASDVAAVLDACGESRATIVGHSMGGYVALAFARMYSERVARLALVCSRLAADDAATAVARNDLARRTEAAATAQPVIDAYGTRLRLSGEALAMAEAIDPRGAAAQLRGMAMRVDAFDIAGELTMPVLVVAGSDDPVVPAEETRAFAQAFPNAELATIAGAAHLPMLEQPDAFIAALRDFCCERD